VPGCRLAELADAVANAAVVEEDFFQVLLQAEAPAIGEVSLAAAEG
jgi:hypothetical protein